MSGSWDEWLSHWVSSYQSSGVDPERSLVYYNASDSVIAKRDKIDLAKDEAAVIKKAFAEKKMPISLNINKEKFQCLTFIGDNMLIIKTPKQGAVVYCGKDYMLVSFVVPPMYVNSIVDAVGKGGDSLHGK